MHVAKLLIFYTQASLRSVWTMSSYGNITQMEEALKTVLESVDLDETLVIVTADHSHSVTMNGYPEVHNTA